MHSVHVPILVKPIVEALIEPFLSLPENSEPHWLVDCTLGGGGHVSAFLQEFQGRPELQRHKILGLDQDATAVERAREKFKTEIAQGRLEVVQIRFGDASSILSSRPVLGMLADLGFSSDQIENASRGLSFQSAGPLDMRLDPSYGISCMDWLKQVSEQELETVLREYGEEKFSRRIASAIIERRRVGRLPVTTQDLVDTVVRAVPASARHGRIHVATRTFQALRIMINDELGQLDSLLNDVMLNVKKGGRIAVLSFHSLEDRKVKVKFKRVHHSDVPQAFVSLTKKPVQASDEEMKINPRARSAKLRIGVREC